MAEEEQEEEKKSFIDKFLSGIAKYLPSVEKPTYKQSFNKRLKWTLFALLMYLILSYITVFGVAPGAYDRYRFFELVLGSRFGSIMTLGIGPIVTAGIVLQLLVGSKIIGWDLTKPESRKKFQTANKFLAIVMSIIEAVAFVMLGALPVANDFIIQVAVVLQLAAGGLVVILLDELISKWGFGSGISLFIAVGVAGQIIVVALSPLTLTCASGTTIFQTNIASCIPSATNPPRGLIWNFFIGLINGDYNKTILNLTPLLTTALVFLVVVYIQEIRIDIPLGFTAMRGFGRTWSLKLLYTSNIPVILTSALIANLQLLGRAGITDMGNGTFCGFFGCYDSTGSVIGGLVYYLSSPGRGVAGTGSASLLGDIVSGVVVSSEIVRAFTYLLFMSITAMIFSIFWVSTSGMDAESVANQIESSGMHIPGYRSDKKSMEQVLNKYIPALALLGGLVIGLIAAFADFVGALGTGTGMLLTTMIIYNYYEELSNQDLEEAHPLIKKVLGG